jgi:hypothetical protein
MQGMLLPRRVLKRKEADRALWVTLFVLTVLGVGVAMWLTARAEKKQVGRTEELAPSEFVENPVVHRVDSVAPAAPLPSVTDSASHPDSTTSRGVSRSAALPGPPARPTAGTPASGSAPGPVPKVVALLTTPTNPTVAAMTAACRNAIQARGPWRDARAGQTWPECTDGAGNPMVVQFCTYARLASGEWVLSENNRRAPRCQAEFPLVRDGKLKGLASR